MDLERGEVIGRKTGRSGGRGNYDWAIMYKRRINNVLL